MNHPENVYHYLYLIYNASNGYKDKHISNSLQILAFFQELFSGKSVVMLEGGVAKCLRGVPPTSTVEESQNYAKCDSDGQYHDQDNRQVASV